MASHPREHRNSGGSEKKGLDGIFWPVLALLAMGMLSIYLFDNAFGQVLGVILTGSAVTICGWKLMTVMKQRRENRESQ